MNSEATNPMIQKQIYDDTILQRRTKFLVSGLLLCFVIAIASLAISIMMLMKGQDIPEFAANLQTALANDNKLKLDLEKEISFRKELEMKMEKLILANNKLTMPPIISEDENTNADNTDQTDTGDDSTKHEQSFVEVPDDIIDKIDRPDQRANAPPLYDYDDSSHIHHGDHDHSITEDIFFGSGDYDNEYGYTEDDEDHLEGSGGCPPVSKPICGGDPICLTDDDCPVPFCCEY